MIILPQSKPESCQGCPYFDRVMITGDGPKDAQLIIIGQSPGPTEKEEGYPFAGASGNVLNTALRKAEISRVQSYVTNVVKCFVPAGVKVDPEATKKCRPLLQKELNGLTSAKTILTVGKEAFDDLTGKDLKFSHDRKSCESNPRAWLRGVPYQLPSGTIVIGTVHPSFVMRIGFLNAPTFEHDVKRAGEFAEGRLKIPSVTHSANPTSQEVIEYVDLIIHKGEGGVDIETPRVRLDEDEADAILELPITQIGISADYAESISVPPDLYKFLDPLLGVQGQPGSAKKTILWAYAGGFDYMHLGKYWSLDNIQPADALVAFHLLWSDVQVKDLATAQSYYSTVPYYKNWALLQPQLYDTIGNCYDTFTCMEIGKACLAEGAKKSIDMRPLFWSLMPIIKAVEPWRTRGCNYNRVEAMKAAIILKRTLEAYEKFWHEKIPFYDWSSPKQLIQMFEKMKVKVPLRKRQKGNYTPSVDDEALEDMVKKGISTAKLIQNMRSLRHAGDFLFIESDRVKTRAKQHGQVGGRLQLVDKNLQQIPEQMESIFPRSYVIPDHPDDLILQADYSQAEFFIYGWYCQDPTILAIKESGDYIYGWFHEQLWKEPFFQEGKPRKKKYRRKDVLPSKLLITKSYPLGFTYGRRQVPSEYKWIYTWYHGQFRRVSPYHNELLFRAAKDGYLQTVFGRMRRFPNSRGQHNEILAFPGQTTLADILLNYAVIPLTRDLPRFFGERSRVLFTVHDSVVCNIQGARRSLEVACRSIDFVNTTLQVPIAEMNGFSVPAETKIGLNWHHQLDRDEIQEKWREISGIPIQTTAVSH